MKFTLIQPPLIKDDRQSLNPPLGLLTLGAVLREESVEVEIIDFNLMGFRDPDALDPETFYQRATDLIADTNPDVVGFTSMALESHVGLKLADLLKQRDQGIKTLFGGPHFSSIATEAMNLYPWMDYVITGEAETPIIDLVTHLRGHKSGSDLVNIARRTPFGVQLDRRYRANMPLDDIPFPAHDLVNLDEYFEINPFRMLCLEHARGCQLRCSFCYSEAHWGHGEQSKSIDRTVSELTRMSDLGSNLAFFVADNFLTNKKAARELCAAIAEPDLPISWKCYGTLAQLDRVTVRAMAKAKCVSVFVGVDAVSAFNKKEFRKTYFKGWESLRTTLDTCLEYNVQPTCSFMLSNNDSDHGIESTLIAALLTKVSGAYVCINSLSIYNQTSLSKEGAQFRHDNSKPRLLFDAPYVNQVNTYAYANSNLFPMHQSCVDARKTFDFQLFCHVAYRLIVFFPLTTNRLRVDCRHDVSAIVSKLIETQGANTESPSSWNVIELANYLLTILPLFPNSILPEQVLKYELARYSLRCNTKHRRRALCVDGVDRLCEIAPSEVVTLMAPPEQLSKQEPVCNEAGFTRYVLTGDPNKSTGVIIDKPAAQALLRLKAGRCAKTELSMHQYQWFKVTHILKPIVDVNRYGD